MTARTLPDPHFNAELYRDVPTKRLVAWLIDVVVTVLMTAILVPFTLFTALWYLPFLYALVSFIYRWATLSTKSATWGMRFTAIEIRAADSGPLGGGGAFLHTLGYHLSVAIFPLQLVSIVMMLMSEKKQGLTDHVLGTAALNRAAGY